MDKNRDIYKTSDNGPQKERELALVDLTPAQIRSRILRQTLFVVVVMLLLLALAAWFISMDGQKQEPDIPEFDPPSTTLPPRPTATAATNLPGLAESVRLSVPDPVQRFSRAEAPKPDPEKMALAMNEVRMGQQYLQARDWDNAELRCRKALEVWPDMNQALRMLGIVHTQRGHFDQAIVVLEKAIRNDPFNAEAYNSLATAYMQKGQLDKAEELLEMSLRIRPEYRIAFINMGLLSLLRGRYEAAADYFERSLEQVPDEAAPRNNLAVALIRLGRYDEARKHLETIVRLHPDIPDSYFNIAISHVLESDFAEAMKWIRRGGERSGPAACRKFLTDSDFNAIRGYPEFQAYINSLYPKIPVPHGP